MSKLTEELDILDVEPSPRFQNSEVTEILDFSRTARRYDNLKLAYTIFGRKYYTSPLKLINEEIKLLDKDLKEIPHDIRTVNIEPFDIEIKTYFNENHRGILTDNSSKVIGSVHPKYEYYVNFSKVPGPITGSVTSAFGRPSGSIFITCPSDFEPVCIHSIEINVVRKLVRDNKIIRETTMF